MNPAGIILEATKVARGSESSDNFLLYIFVAVVVESALKVDSDHMDLIYMPEGYELPVFIILIAFAFIAPLVTALFMKNESKHKNAKWNGKYTASLIIDMVLTPSLGIIAMSLITQAWFPGMDAVAYMVFLPIVLIIVAYLALKVMNEGIKAVADQIVGTVGEAKEAVEDVQKSVNVRPKL